MGSKTTLLFGFVLLIFFNISLLKQTQEKKSNALLFANPITFKFLSGVSHNILADSLWLLGSTVSEVAFSDSHDVNQDDFVKASKTIATMDPFFYEANNYAITYLATVAKDLDNSLGLIRQTRFFDEKNFKLYFLDLVFLVTYAKDHNRSVDFHYIKEMAEKMTRMPKGKKVLGKLNVDKWVAYLKLFADDELLRLQQKREHLEYLLKETKEPQKRKLIEKKIKLLL